MGRLMNIKLIASEIVRAMTPAKLEKKQEEYLLHCAQIVIENHLRKADVIREYEIWAEGYCANETGGKWTEPVKLGVSSGISFEDACIWKFKNDKHFDHNKMTYWGCRLYPVSRITRDS